MDFKLTVGATPELTGLAVALTNLINDRPALGISSTVANIVGAKAEEVAETEVEAKVEKVAEKAKAARTRTKKEEPGVQEPPKKEEVEEEDDKPAKEAKKDDTEGGAITIEEIRKVQRKVSLKGGIAEMKKILATFTTAEGEPATSASELDESDYDAYYEKLVELV